MERSGLFIYEQRTVPKLLYTTGVRVSAHLILWTIVTTLYYLTYRRLDASIAWIFTLKDLVTVTVIFYITAYVILPKCILPAQLKIWPCLLWLPLAYLWWGINTNIASYLVINYTLPSKVFYNYANRILNNGIWAIFEWDKLSFYFLDFVYLVTFPLGMKFMQIIMQERNRRSVLERDNFLLELDFLKSQINPHFLFNTLNNLYVMVSKNDPKAVNTILSISGLMRYTLYECDEPFVPLSSEIEYIRYYLELQHLRYEEGVEIHTRIASILDDYRIVPLILFHFIENAFKHGPDNSRESAWVHIDLSVKADMLHLMVSNNYKTKGKELMTARGGVGLKNAYKRLALYYPQKHKLNITETINEYIVNLEIDLNF